jgi:signal transduction histidine kinase
MRFGRDSARMAMIIALLGATFLLTAFVALRAQLAASYHRATAEKVIRDWSAVAADEFARRAENYATFYGTYYVLQAIWDAPHPPSREEVAATSVSSESLRNAHLVKHTFRVDVRTGKVEVSHGMPESLRQWITAEMPRALSAGSSSGEQKPLQVMVEGIEHTLVYAVSRTRGSAMGIDVNLEAITPFFAQAMKGPPLLPSSLAEGRISNRDIFIRVHDGKGRPLYHSAARSDAPIVARRHIERGLLRGMSVEAAIAPSVARFLVIGGVPRPSLGLYVSVLAASAVLLLIAVFQLQKELALGRLRSDFVASVSHELRTPLTQIRMFAETLLLDRVRSGEERLRALTIIDQESRRLTQVVDNVLQFSRGERGMLRITPGRCDMVRIAVETIGLFAPIAAARQMRVGFSSPQELFGDFDEGALRQVLLNLLDNAVKYGPPGQQVNVTVTREGAFARIAVDDQGPGIPPAERRRAWHRYYRLRRERERAIAGAGIGLSVVRELVALHGGLTRLEGSAGGGLRAVVELPTEAKR